MKLLNLCCGAVRPQGEEWVNVDNIRVNLHIASPERINLDKEKNYIDLNITMEEQRLPTRFSSGEFDGILASHCVEHWDCRTAVKVISDCFYCLKPGGVLLVSVPDASYFRKVYDEDTVENAERLFGEPIHLPDGETTFLGYGLFNRFHKAILTEDALWSYFVRAGFSDKFVMKLDREWLETTVSYVNHPLVVGRIDHGVLDTMVPKLNRIPFSLVMCGVKE